MLNLTVEAGKGPWSLNLSMETAITTETGEMTDTDWLDYFSADNTHWSLSRIWLDNSFLLNAGLTYSFNLFDNLKIPIGLGYQLNFWDWEDKVLNFVYPDPQPADFIGKNGIDYKVTQNIFYASAGILFTTGKITTGFNLALSPYINAWNLDHHVLTGTFYRDFFTANFWYRTELTAKIKTGSNEEVVLTAFREVLPEVSGDTNIYEENPFNSEEPGAYTGTYTDGAGMASVLWGMQFSYIWKF